MLCWQSIRGYYCKKVGEKLNQKIRQGERHKQVAAKVTAFVDEPLKELIEILNTFDNISTFESCQGGDGKLAFVLMDYGDLSEDFDKVAAFTHKLAKALADAVNEGTGISPDPSYDTNLAVEWDGDKRHPFVAVRFPSDSIGEVTRIFAHVRNEFENGK